MSKTRRVAPLQRLHAPIIAHHLSTSRLIEPPRDARASQDTFAMDWRRLRTMVDALLRRAATTKRGGTATSTTPQTQEAIHG
jgi:hypothetical protein